MKAYKADGKARTAQRNALRDSLEQVVAENGLETPDLVKINPETGKRDALVQVFDDAFFEAYGDVYEKAFGIK